MAVNTSNFLFNIALDCIQGYNFLEPFANYIKGYFHANHKLGSRDRRNIRHLCYAWWRLGNAGSTIAPNERLAIAFYLSYHDIDAFSERIFKESSLLDSISRPVSEKWKLVQKEFAVELTISDLFPCQHLLESDVNVEQFSLDGFNRRALWIRMKNDFRDEVISFFKKENIIYHEHDTCTNALMLPYDFDAANSLPYQNGWMEIQDLSSQIAGSWYQSAGGKKWLDACAASGGKSLQLMDNNSNIQLTVTDIRESILDNLSARFKRNNIKNYKAQICDWTNKDQIVFSQNQNYFDSIIADVPCSGSGTWSRTPEQKQIITIDKIKEYADLQFTIAVNLLNQLKSEGVLYYSTCSVYQLENSGVVARLIETGLVNLIKQELIQGEKDKADSMFIAKLIKV